MLRTGEYFKGAIMKRLTYSILLLILAVQINIVSAGPDDPVYFADINLKAAVEAALDVNNPTENDMLELTLLNAQSLGINDLTGLEYATNLNYLYLCDNQISDISALEGLTDLIILYLYSNQISDISSVEGLTNLTHLYLYNNQISNISAVEGLTNLTYLYLYSNQISDISAVEGLTNLTKLYLASNQISDISALSGLTNLNYLDLQNNNIFDISSVSEMTNITWINLTINRLNYDSYYVYIPQIQANNPGATILYDDEPVSWKTLTISSTEGGSVTIPGEGEFQYAEGQEVEIEAVSQNNYYLFTYWSGTAQRFGKVSDTFSNKTTIIVDNDYTLIANFKEINPIEHPNMGYLLDKFNFNDFMEFIENVLGNNFVDPNNPQFNRPHIEYVGDLEPDPKGMMRMQNLEDVDPASPTYGRKIYARSKIALGKCSKLKVVIRFSYLFERYAPGLKLVVYLSDVPEILDRNDPQRFQHYLKIGRIPSPPPWCPGSVDSGIFATFEKWVSTGLLDFSEGMWVELVLEENQSQENMVSSMYNVFSLYSPEGEGGSILVDDLTSEIRCSIVCMDITGDRNPDEEDFMLVIASCGYPASLLEEGTGGRACLDGLFSTDDYVDLYDIMSWDWALSDDDRTYELLNLCEIPIFDVTSIMSLSSESMEGIVGSISSPVDLPNSLDDLLIVGKRDTGDVKSKDSLYIFDNTGQYIGWSEPSPNRCNTKLIKGPDGKLYLINSNKGIISLDGTGDVIVPPGQTTYDNEPRYSKPASVYIGVQERSYSFFGRPVFDAALDANYVYVVPVLVKPQDANAYLAAAKIELFEEGEPPYQVVRLYDDLIDVNDNQTRDNLREIEVDEDGNVYVINSNNLNNSDILWKYSSEGLLLDRLNLGYPDSNNYVPDPVAMHISDVNDMVYIASGQYGHEPNSVTIYGFSTDDFTLERTIKINDMQHITSITEDPATGILWVGGFNMYDVPTHFNPYEQAFYYPYIAEIPVGVDEVLSLPIYDPDNHDLAMPISIIWTGNN